MLTQTQQVIVDKLWEVGAIKIDISEDGGFTIKAQENDPTIPNSPIYLNIRTEDHPKNPGAVTQEIMDLIGDEFFAALNKDDDGWNFSWFADIPHAGTPFGDQIERIVGQYVSTDLGRLQLSKTEHADGSREIASDVRIVYGDVTTLDDANVVLIDDLITKASTKLEAIKALETAGFKVVKVLVLVNRGSGVTDLRRLGYDVVAIMSLYDIIDYLLRSRRISHEEHSTIRRYLAP
jgi:hypothetical protein